MTQGFTEGMRSSLTDEWATPTHVFKALDKEFNFDIDVCADESNHKCAHYFSKVQDGLKQDWNGSCWMNPPYGRAIGQWVKKAYESARGGGHRGLPIARSHGHTLVGVILHEGQRDQTNTRAP